MNADQGFRKAPGSLLWVAVGAGATALIVTVVSAARRAGTARANRDSGPAQDSQVPPSASPDVSPSPAAPEAAKASDLAVGQIAISTALLIFTATALPAIVGRRRDGGKRGAAHARTSRRQAANGDDAFRRRCLLTSVIPGSSARRGAYARIRPRTTPGRLGMKSSGPSTRMTTPAGPGAQARTLSIPITRAGEEGVLTRAGTPPNRPCGRTATLAGPSPRPRLGATPNRRRRMTVPAGGAAEVPRDKDRCPRHTAARTAGQPRARDRSCPRRRGRTTLLEPASPPGPDRLLLQAGLPGQPPPPPQATPRGRDPPTLRVQAPLPRPTSFPAMDRCFSQGRRGSWNGVDPRLTGFPGLTGSSPHRVRSGMRLGRARYLDYL